MTPEPPASQAPIRSMTGYASVRQQSSAGELTVSLRSVNHRGLDLHFYLGGEMAPFENSVRTLLKSSLVRGHVEVRVSLAADPEQSRVPTYNRELLSRYVSAFRQASAEFGLTAEPDLTKLFSMPGVLETSREARQLAPAFEGELLAAFAACAQELNDYRAREAELRRMLQAGGEVRKRLDFLLQERCPRREGLASSREWRGRASFRTLAAVTDVCAALATVGFGVLGLMVMQRSARKNDAQTLLFVSH